LDLHAGEFHQIESLQISPTSGLAAAKIEVLQKRLDQSDQNLVAAPSHLNKGPNLGTPVPEGGLLA
jgi:hypothetical protein